KLALSVGMGLTGNWLSLQSMGRGAACAGVREGTQSDPTQAIRFPDRSSSPGRVPGQPAARPEFLGSGVSKVRSFWDPAILGADDPELRRSWGLEHPGAGVRAEEALALEQVDRLGEVGDADVLGQGGVLALDGFVHFPGDAAIAEMTGGPGTEFGDVLCLGEVHFEEAAEACSQWKQVEGGLGGFRCRTGG